MNRNLRNQLRPALLVTTLAIAATAVVLWSAASTQPSRAAESYQFQDRPVAGVAATAAQSPTAQIWSPERDAIVTAQDVLTITGYAWQTGVEPPFLPDDPVLRAQRADDRSYFLSWTAVISAQGYVRQESMTADFRDFTSKALETTSELITKDPADDGTYYYRVRAVHPDLAASRWSNVVPVIVPWTATENDATLDTAAAALTVEVRIDGGAWHTAAATDAGWAGGGGWEWSYAWSPLPEENNVQHLIEARATDGTGEMSAVDGVTFTLNNRTLFVYLPFIRRYYPPIPHAPTLNAIANPDKADNYSVSWSYNLGTPPVSADSFTLQEDDNAAFSSPTEHNTTGTSMAFSGKAAGTYYYRVRAHNVYGSGPWSNVVSTQVETGFFDDFSDTSTGWPHNVTFKRGTAPDGPVMHTRYTGGTYQIRILLDTTGLNNKRMGVIPSPWVNPHSDYDVQVDHFFTRAPDQPVDPTWGKAGLIFGANSSFSTIYAVEWHFPSGSDTPQCAVYRYTNITLPTSIVWLAGGTAIRDWSACSALKSGYDKTNQIRVEVRGAHATVYINSTMLGTFSDPGIASMHRVGLVTGSWELTPVESRFDNFRVTSK